MSAKAEHGDQVAGGARSPGIMSFPRAGYTLTLDFPNKGDSTLALLAELDRITVDAGGAVNPYKDARMSAATFAASFPDWRLVEAVRDPAFTSDFWRRTAGRLTGSAGALPAADAELDGAAVLPEVDRRGLVLQREIEIFVQRVEVQVVIAVEVVVDAQPDQIDVAAVGDPQ